jgi:hypothetical protein
MITRLIPTKCKLLDYISKGLIILILTILSVPTLTVLNSDSELTLLELVELAEETEEKKESEDNTSEEDSKDYFVNEVLMSSKDIIEFDRELLHSISLYKSLCLDVKGAPPDLLV